MSTSSVPSISTPSVRFSSCSFAFREDVPLLDRVDLHLGVGWTGLVGANGAGKSTLLSLLTGDLEPTAGTVELWPRPARCRLCPQSVEVLDEAITSFSWDWSGPAQRLRGKLRLQVEDLERWSSLSPGERKRWQLATALYAEPDILLLDEPTNHLDAEGRELLIDALRTFCGVGIVVAHDRQLLDRLTHQTVRLEHGEVTVFAGSYSAAQAAWRQEATQQRQVHADLRRQEKALRRRRHAAHQRQNAASANRKPRRGKPDSDDRTAAAGSRKRKAQNRAGRSAELLNRRLESTAQGLEKSTVRKEKGGALVFDASSYGSQRLVSLDVDDLVVPGIEGQRTTILRAVHLWVDGRDRIWVRGPNGSGKSTLLGALLREIPERLQDDVLYLPQELEAFEGQALLQAVRDLSAETRGQVLQVVAALGVDPQRLMASRQPSPGEARKLKLAWGLGRQARLLILDEPTNHLDLPSIERLEAALAEYPGAVVLVTHDDALASRVTEMAWRVEEGGVKLTSTARPSG